MTLLLIGIVLGYAASELIWMYKTGALYYFAIKVRNLKRKVFGE